MNPLPTFAADGSFGILAELEGRPLEALLADVIASALARLGLARRARHPARAARDAASAGVERLDLADAATASAAPTQLRAWLEPTPDECAGIASSPRASTS